MNEQEYIPLLQKLNMLSPSQRLHHSLESSETSTEEILAVKVALHQCPHCGFVESLPELDVEEVYTPIGFNGRLQWCCQDTSQKSQYRHKSERHAANV